MGRGVGVPEGAGVTVGADVVGTPEGADVGVPVGTPEGTGDAVGAEVWQAFSCHVISSSSSAATT